MTTNNKCKKCGCEDSFMPSPAPCPTPAGCPTPEPCSEVMDSQCIIYTGANIECDQDTVVTTNDTVAEALENIVGYFCSNQPVEFQYEIGQYVEDEGGVIAHRWLSTTALGSPEAGTFQNYLVVDIDDLSNSTPFEPGTPIISSSYFSSWNGLSNNTNLISAGGGGVGTAVYLCVNSTNNGKTDWYLPAIDELSKIWQNRFDIAQGLINAGGTQFVLYGFVGGNYYCSSTAQGETVAIFNFTYGHPIFNDVGNPYAVRAVRKFSI